MESVMSRDKILHLAVDDRSKGSNQTFAIERDGNINSPINVINYAVRIEVSCIGIMDGKGDRRVGRSILLVGCWPLSKVGEIE